METSKSAENRNGYRLWKTNYMAYDMVTESKTYADRYTIEDLESFKSYLAQRMMMVEPNLDREALMDILLHIYSNPVLAKEEMNSDSTTD
jgi:hypothetical protein